MFQTLDQEEKKKVISSITKGRLTFVGRTANKLLLLAKPIKDKAEGFKLLECEFRSNQTLKAIEAVTFSFVGYGKKYLFKANCHFRKDGTAIVEPTTDLFFIQRRASERLQLPESYYSMLKLQYINNKHSRAFAKIKDISISGCGCVLRSSEIKLNKGDIIKGEMHFSSRPPLDIEAQIRHLSFTSDLSVNVVNFGLLYLPVESAVLAKKMKILIMDLYRDFFPE